VKSLFSSTAVIVLLLISAGGCEQRRIVYSEPYIIREDGERKSIEGKFEFPGIKLAVVPHNTDISYGIFWYGIPWFPTPGRTLRGVTQSFSVSFILDPEGEDFTFDAGKNTFVIDQEKYFPTYYIGPVGRVYYQGGGWNCNTDKKSYTRIYARNESIPIQEWSCFVILFETSTPSPTQSFQISLDGISLKHKPFPLPPIFFRMKEGWQMHRDL
jgi:hypothetical protein